MFAEHAFRALDKKAGMKLSELEAAMESVRQMSPGKKFHVKATVGFNGALQTIRFFEEVGDVVPQAAPEGA